MYEKYIKRLLDIILSIAAIIILSPVFCIISALVLLKMGPPVLFGQRRIGKGEKGFTLYKFRSMTNETDIDGHLLPEKDRLTRFGIALRSSSLDELPELFSILKGDMSFVGPRPLPTYYGPFFSEEERRRHRVRGGLIPPDSLEGKATTDWETQFRYEVDYAEKVSLLLDIKIIAYTFLILFNRLKTNYGAGDRPHLNKYRSHLEISQEAMEHWNKL